MINNRIKELRKHLQINQTDFAKKLGVTQPSLSDIEKGKTQTIDERNIKLICSEFNVNEEWLRYGKGIIFNKKPLGIFAEIEKVFDLDDLDKKMIEAYIQLNSIQRKVFKDYIKSIVEEKDVPMNKESNILYLDRVAEEPASYLSDRSESYQSEQHYVPLYGKVAGGHPILAIAEYGKKVKTNVKCDVALELVGNSMAPEYIEGDILLIQRREDLEQGELGIILRMDGADVAEATFKKFYRDNGNVRLEPLNLNYQSIIWSSGHVKIYGKVVGKA